MAITKTTTVHRIEVYPAIDSSAADTSSAKHATMTVIYEDILDDPDDAELPAAITRVKSFTRYVEDGGAATDLAAEDNIVQDIAAALWT